MRSTSRGLAGALFHEVESVRVVEYCPTNDGSGPSTEVHLVIRIAGIGCELLFRFQQRKALDAFLERITGYRDLVWPPQT